MGQLGPGGSALLAVIVGEVLDALQRRAEQPPAPEQPPVLDAPVTKKAGSSSDDGEDWDIALRRREAEEDRLHALAFAEDQDLLVCELDHVHTNHCGHQHHAHCGC